jgi:hypothetical protein
MKVDFTAQSRAKLAALPDADGRIARDIVRRLRSAKTPIGIRIPGSPASYSATLGQAGGSIVYETEGAVATVIRVLSSAQRELRSHSSRTAESI